MRVGGGDEGTRRQRCYDFHVCNLGRSLILVETIQGRVASFVVASSRFKISAPAQTYFWKVVLLMFSARCVHRLRRPWQAQRSRFWRRTGRCRRPWICWRFEYVNNDGLTRRAPEGSRALVQLSVRSFHASVVCISAMNWRKRCWSCRLPMLICRAAGFHVSVAVVYLLRFDSILWRSLSLH